jgi:hypothetical protein
MSNESRDSNEAPTVKIAITRELFNLLFKFKQHFETLIETGRLSARVGNIERAATFVAVAEKLEDLRKELLTGLINALLAEANRLSKIVPIRNSESVKK